MLFTVFLTAATSVIAVAHAQGVDVNSLNNGDIRSTVDFTASNDFGPGPVISPTPSPQFTDKTIGSTVSGFMTTAGGVESTASSAGGFTIQTETSLTASETGTATATEASSTSAAPSATENAANVNNQKGLLGVGVGVVMGLAGVL